MRNNILISQLTTKISTREQAGEQISSGFSFRCFFIAKELFSVLWKTQ